MSESAYPSLSALLNLQTQTKSGDYNLIDDDALDVVANAPPAIKSTQEPLQKQYRVRGEARDKLEHYLEQHACGVCDARIVAHDDSFVVFAECKHIVHLACLSSRLSVLPDAKTLRGGPNSLCTRCAHEELERAADTTSTVAHSKRRYRDPEELLAQYKVQYRKTHPNQPSYDRVKDERLSDDEQLQLLRVAPHQSMLRSEAAKRFLAAANNFVSRIRAAEPADEAEHDDDDDDEVDEVKRALSRGTFVQAALVANRNFSDILCTERGSLMTLYQCGAQSLNELQDLGFDPVVHFHKEYRRKVPIWQLYDLYGFRIQHLIGKDYYGLTMRELSKMHHIKPAEWAMLGASAQMLISLGMQREDIRGFRMDLSQWQRYMDLQPAHLTALGITTRRVFVDELGWDRKHEWCPVV